MSSMQVPIQNQLTGVGMSSNQSLNYCNQKSKCGNMEVPTNMLAKCEMCDKSYDQHSLTSCPECELIYCMGCCQDIHSKGKLTCHTVFQYMCNICNELSGGYDCFDCGLSFCEVCSTKRHSRGAFTRHTLAIRQSHLAVNVFKTSMHSLDTPCTNSNNNNVPATSVASLKSNSMHNFMHSIDGEDYMPISKKQRLYDPNSNDYNSVLNSPCSKNMETWTLLNSNGIMSPGPSNIVQHGNSIINNYMPPLNGQIRNQQLLNAMSMPTSMLHQHSQLEEHSHGNAVDHTLQDDIASSHALSALVNEFDPIDHVGESHCELPNDGFQIPSPPHTNIGINPSLLMLHKNSNFPSVSPKKNDTDQCSTEFKNETLGNADASCFITNISHDQVTGKKPSMGSPMRSPTSTTDTGKTLNGKKLTLNENVAEKFDLSFLNEKPKKKRRIFNPDEKSRLTNFAESLNWTWQAREVEEFARDNDFTVQQVKDFIYNRKRNMKHSIPDLTKSQIRHDHLQNLSMGMSPPHCAIDQALESITQCSYLSSPDSNPETLPMSDCVFLLDAPITAD